MCLSLIVYLWENNYDFQLIKCVQTTHTSRFNYSLDVWPKYFLGKYFQIIDFPTLTEIAFLNYEKNSKMRK